MNNALRHTALTLAAASALLVLVALPVEPVPAPTLQRAVGPTPAAMESALPSTQDPFGQPSMDRALELPKRVIRKSARHRRQTLVMPFFSFAQRG